MIIRRGFTRRSPAAPRPQSKCGKHRRGRLAQVAGLLLLSIACAPPASDDTAGAGSRTSAGEHQPEVLIPAPDLAGVTLRDQHDQEIDFESLRGKPALLTFIYTRCPMPEMCPATTLRFKEVQQALSAEERVRVRLIAVSFDPFDTPEVLREYAELWEVESGFWSLLTGAPEAIKTVAGAHGAWYEKTDEAVYDHTMLTLVLLPDGSVHQVLTGSAWDSDEVAETLLALAAEGSTRP